jgi:hypothetical protein
MLETRLLLSLRIVTSANAALRLLLDASWLENKQLRITRGSKAHPKWRNVARQSYVVIVAWKLLAAEVAFAAVIFYLPWLAPQGSLWGSIQITPYRLHACLVKPPSEIPRTFPWNWWKHMVLESSSLFQPESKRSTEHRVGIAQLPTGLVVPYTLLICPRHHLSFQSAKGLAKLEASQTDQLLQ